MSLQTVGAGPILTKDLGEMKQVVAMREKKRCECVLLLINFLLYQQVKIPVSSQEENVER